MSRSTAVLVSAVITGFLMVIAMAVVVGVPGAGASDDVNPGEQSFAESVAASQEFLAGNEQSAAQFDVEAISAESLPTPASVPEALAANLPRPEESDVYLDLEWDLVLARDRIAELTALNEALQNREGIYRERVDEANAAIQDIANSWSQPVNTAIEPNPVIAASPSEPPTADAAPTATPVPDLTPEPTPEPLVVEVLPGEELTSIAGDVASLIGTTVWTSRQVYTKSAVIDWGDGSPEQSVTVIQDTGEVFGFHVYREPGTYVIFVTANVDGVKAENWTLINVSEPEPPATPEPTATPVPTVTPAPLPVATPTPGQTAPPPAVQPTGVTFEDAAYIARAISGVLQIKKITIKVEDRKRMFEVEMDDAKVFIDTATGVILFGEHILSSPVFPVPEPPAGMLTFDDAYSIAVNVRPGNVTRIRQSSTTFTVTVSGSQVVIDAYSGQVR